MGTLRFICPKSAREVDTGIEVDPVSFGGLYRERVGCPECLGMHQLSEIEAWVADQLPSDPSINRGLATLA